MITGENVPRRELKRWPISREPINLLKYRNLLTENAGSLGSDWTAYEEEKNSVIHYFLRAALRAHYLFTTPKDIGCTQLFLQLREFEEKVNQLHGNGVSDSGMPYGCIAVLYALQRTKEQWGTIRFPHDEINWNDTKWGQFKDILSELPNEGDKHLDIFFDTIKKTDWKCPDFQELGGVSPETMYLSWCHVDWLMFNVNNAFAFKFNDVLEYVESNFIEMLYPDTHKPRESYLSDIEFKKTNDFLPGFYQHERKMWLVVKYAHLY